MDEPINSKKVAEIMIKISKYRIHKTRKLDQKLENSYLKNIADSQHLYLIFVIVIFIGISICGGEIISSIIVKSQEEQIKYT